MEVLPPVCRGTNNSWLFKHIHPTIPLPVRELKIDAEIVHGQDPVLTKWISTHRLCARNRAVVHKITVVLECDLCGGG